MGFDMQQATTCLQSLDLVTLFQVLGWTVPNRQPAISLKACNHSYRAQCIAQRGKTKVWEIKISHPINLSIQIKTRLHKSIHKKHPQSLTIFIDRQRCRTLWAWQSDHGRLQFLVFVRHQPLVGWHARLRYLANHAGNAPLELHSRTVDCREFTQQLRQQLHQLSENITGIDDSQDQWWYATVLLQRLIIIQLLQQQGLLNNDVWYLHNQLGRSQQQQPNIFFKQILQTIFAQGFSLPELERPRHVYWMGKIPYLGNVFYTHPLEQKYTNINVVDAQFEAILVWFESPLWQRLVNSWQLSAIVLAFEQVVTNCEFKAPEATAESNGMACDLVINQFMIRHLNLELESSIQDIWDILFAGHPPHLRQLVQVILPKFSVVDPACGVGSLLFELQSRLVDIYAVIIGHLKNLTDSQLKIWLQGVENEHPSLLQTIHRRIFQYGLYGVDLDPVAVDSARFQLLLSLIVMAQHPKDVEPLPSIDFNIVLGNSLLGFIRVDEAGFDRLRATETLLQGNLLQPLTAQSYQTVLSEKKIALEYYRSRTHLLEELQQSIPHYAQIEFFRAQIDSLDTQAQAKLDELLLSEFSQALGIKLKVTQLMEPPRRRLLQLEDITALQPFHWGYHFNELLEQQQGFSIILSRPPQGSFRPNIQDFFQRFSNIIHKYSLDISKFKSAKSSLLNLEPEVAKAWLFYQSQYSLMTDYFHRSPQYDHQSPLLKGKRQRIKLNQHWLFIERCFHLLAPQGICGLLIPSDIKDSPRGMALRSLLENKTEFSLLLPSPQAQQPSGQYFLWFLKQPE